MEQSAGYLKYVTLESVNVQLSLKMWYFCEAITNNTTFGVPDSTQLSAIGFVTGPPLLFLHC